MSSSDSSERTPYQRPKRGIAATSSTTETTSELDNTGLKLPATRISTSAAQRKSKFLTLIRYIANATGVLQSSHEFTLDPSLEISKVEGETLEFIGKGKTFYVSRLPLPAGVGLNRSWPNKLFLRPPVLVEGPRGYESDAITCKRPLIEFDSSGNPKEGAVEDRLEAVILEIRVLTHPPIYLHKNIVDFLGISWQCELPEIDPDQTTIAPAHRIPTILLEYAQHGSLADFRRKELYSAMSFQGRASLCRDVAEGLAVLHRHGIVHGDIKLDNILIFEANDNYGSSHAFGLRAKLADFGFSVGQLNEAHEGSDGVQRWKLMGRTWPWNDPEWNQLRDWSQLQKTDVFSYGLLVWTILTGKDIGSLFDLDGADYDRNDRTLREMVEGLKDWTLSWNAASYFIGKNKVIQLLVECLFQCSLESRVDLRGTMEDIIEIWNVWFMGDPPYQSIPPGIDLGPQLGLQIINRVSFQRIIAYASDLPSSIRKEFTEMYFDPYLSADGKCEATVFRAFSHLIGWGVDQDVNEAKRLIDDAASRTPSVAIFQPMFFEPGRRDFKSAGAGACTEYERKVFQGLMIMAEGTRSYEVFRQLIRYFPMPIDGSYTRMRSILYRKHFYGIHKYNYPCGLCGERGSELVALQLADIESHYLTEGVLKWEHSQLHFAVFSGFIEAVDLILESEEFDRQSLEKRDFRGYTPLLAACSLGSFKIAELLIEAGADVKALTDAGETILHFLNEFDNPEELAEISDLILALGGKALMHTVCRDRSFPIEFLDVMMFLIGPPLNSAIMRGNIALVRILLKHGVDPRKGGVFSGEDSPLTTAATGHFAEILKLFSEAYPDAREWRDCTLLKCAIHGFAGFQKMYFHGHLKEKMMEDTLDLLLDKVLSAGFPLKIGGDIPLIHHAVSHGDLNTTRHIISRIGTSEINTYFQGVTPLHLAISVGSNEKFDLLIKHGADPHLAPDSIHPTSNLRYCCCQWGGTNQMVKYLVDHGVGQDASGSYPDVLTDAIGVNNFEAASILLAAGANIDEITTRGGGWTTLGLIIRTCTYNSVPQMRFLLDHQVVIGKKPASFLVIPSMGYTALHVVAIIPITTPFYDRNTMSDVLDYLLDKFCSPKHINAQDKNGYTALHHAACSGNGKVVQRLLAFDTTDTKIQTNTGITAYQCALFRALQDVPRNVLELGDRAVERYKKDGREVIDLFSQSGRDPSLQDFIL